MKGLWETLTLSLGQGDLRAVGRRNALILLALCSALSLTLVVSLSWRVRTSQGESRRVVELLFKRRH
jgi:hypothetical protein